jgi:signal peptidase I
MVNKQKTIVIIISAFLVILITGSFLTIQLGFISAFKASSISMEPSLKQDQRFFVWSTKHFHRNDIVTYHYKPQHSPDSVQISLAISRIAGIGKDKIQLKRGLLYVNDSLTDDSLKLNFFFLVSKNELPPTQDFTIQKENLFDEGDSVLINTSYNKIEELHLQGKAIRFFAQYSVGYPFFEHSNESWTMENFGPVYVPQDCYFLISDNRSNASDSRLKGFVRKNDLAGKVILIH